MEILNWSRKTKLNHSSKTNKQPNRWDDYLMHVCFTSVTTTTLKPAITSPTPTENPIGGGGSGSNGDGMSTITS